MDRGNSPGAKHDYTMPLGTRAGLSVKPPLAQFVPTRDRLRSEEMDDADPPCSLPTFAKNSTPDVMAVRSIRAPPPDFAHATTTDQIRLWAVAQVRVVFRIHRYLVPIPMPWMQVPDANWVRPACGQDRNSLRYGTPCTLNPVGHYPAVRG